MIVYEWLIILTQMYQLKTLYQVKLVYKYKRKILLHHSKRSYQNIHNILSQFHSYIVEIAQVFTNNDIMRNVRSD